MQLAPPPSLPAVANPTLRSRLVQMPKPRAKLSEQRELPAGWERIAESDALRDAMAYREYQRLHEDYVDKVKTDAVEWTCSAPLQSALLSTDDRRRLRRMTRLRTAWCRPCWSLRRCRQPLHAPRTTCTGCPAPSRIWMSGSRGKGPARLPTSDRWRGGGPSRAPSPVSAVQARDGTEQKRWASECSHVPSFLAWAIRATCFWCCIPGATWKDSLLRWLLLRWGSLADAASAMRMPVPSATVIRKLPYLAHKQRRGLPL